MILSRVQEIYRYRSLLWNLVKRDLKVRYKNSILGFFWSLLNPLLMMAVLTVVFSVVMRVPVERFPIFLLCGLLPWNFFSVSLSNASGSIVGGAGLLKKVYFPREVLPLSAVFANLVNFLLALAVFFPFFLVFHVHLTWLALLLPVAVLLELLFTAGICLIFACLNVFYRDITQILEVMLLIWYFLSPVFYPTSMVPARYLPLYMLNPMAVFISFYRDLLFLGHLTVHEHIVYATLVSFLVMLAGLWMFGRFAHRFAEEL